MAVTARLCVTKIGKDRLGWYAQVAMVGQDDETNEWFVSVGRRSLFSVPIISWTTFKQVFKDELPDLYLLLCERFKGSFKHRETHNIEQVAAWKKLPAAKIREIFEKDFVREAA